jgi:hypothetical protein
LILFAVSHVAISATGGYGTPHLFLTLAVAFGVGLGAVFSGAAWAAQRYTLAIALVGAIVAGEAFGSGEQVPQNETALAVERCAQGQAHAVAVSGEATSAPDAQRLMTRLPRRVRPVYVCAHDLEG